MRKPSAYQLYQQANALMERVDALALSAKGYSKTVGDTFEASSDKLAEGLDLLKKELDRRRALREKYDRDLKSGREP